jgi:transglutaminase-like putative cysteine protease
MLVLSQLKKKAYLVTGRVNSLLLQIREGPSEGRVTFVLLLLSVMVAVWSVGSAQWAPTPGLYGLAFGGVVLGLLIAKMRSRAWILFTSGLLLGFYLSFHQLTRLVEGATALERYTEAGNRLFLLARSLVGSDVSPEPLLISFFLLFASWLAGFLCSWSFFRKHSIWGAVLPSGILIVVNLAALLPGEQKFPFYLYLFLICVFVARLVILERERNWDRRSVQRRERDSVLLPKAFRFALVVVIVTSLLPTPSIRIDPVAVVWDRISSPVRVMEEKLGGFARGVPAENPVYRPFFGNTSVFRAGITLGEEPVLIVEAPFPVHLRARSYDVYTHTGWETGDTQMVSPELTAQREPDEESKKSQQVEVSAKVMFSLAAGEPIYLGGYPVDMSIDYQLEVLKPARYQISLPGSDAQPATGAENLPLDMQEAVLHLQEMNRACEYTLTEADIRAALPDDVRVVSCGFSTKGVEEITLERDVPWPPDTLSVRTTGPVSAGDSYQATVTMSAATESDLLTAGTGYPGWVLDSYLQLPDTMPSRVIDLAQELTKDIETPYEKAVAIRDYLRAFEYAPDIKAPPYGTDGVDYFLFELKEGYCTYFASAMTVLLRSCGVASRIVTGYSLAELIEQYAPEDIMDNSGGVPQDLQDAFVVRNGHSWSEVFFPGYGWIPFEPTPAYPLIARGDFSFPPPDVEDSDDSAIKPGIKETGDTSTPWNVRFLGVALGLALFGVTMWLVWRRLLGRVSEPRVAYARIGYLAALSGAGPRESLTPQEYGRKLAAAVPEMAAALNQIVHAYVRVSYSRHDLSTEDRSGIEKAWPQVRNHLLRRALRSIITSKALSKRARF